MSSGQPQSVLLPENILDIISCDELTNFLRGYNNVTFTGVALYYHTRSGCPTSADSLSLIDSTRGQQERNYHPFCRTYRTDSRCDAMCIDFDKMIAMQYYSGTLSEPMLYRCHRELWDMAYPLRVEGRLFGVLFAGQMVLRQRKGPTAWRRELDEIYSEIKWSFGKSDPNHPDQHEDIVSSLQCDRQLSDETIKQLTDVIVEDKASVTINEIVKRYKDFIEFGRITVSLLSQLYQARRDAVQLRESEARLKEQRDHDQFHNELLGQLFEARPEHLLSWQSHLKACFSEIVKLYNVERVGIFHGHPAANARDSVSYELVAMNSSKWWDTNTFILPKRQLLKKAVTFSPGQLLEPFGRGVGQKLADSKYFHVYPYAYEHAHVYTLIVIQNATRPPDSVLQYLGSVCERISRRDEVVRLSLWLRSNYDDFSQHVIQVRHDLNTSVQAITDNVEKYYLMLQRGLQVESEACEKQYDLVWDAVESHAARIRTLNSNVEERHTKIESVNLRAAIEKEATLYQATAQKKSVRIVVNLSDLLCDSYVVCEPSELRRAVAALLDNAIKYSFDDKDIYVTCMCRNRRFSLSIQNYGIGIPPEQLAKIKNKHFMRGMVKDPYRVREGTGMGLHIANEVFVDMLKGTLQITSVPDHNIKRLHDEKYHRYVTTVKCVVPVDV